MGQHLYSGGFMGDIWDPGSGVQGFREPKAVAKAIQLNAFECFIDWVSCASQRVQKV